ncbi:MAG: chitosanase [Alphaproteobacteria bacterium]|nr:chitosanase [Alphaproteobacteria bacterium]
MRPERTDVIKRIINVFETGRAEGDYGAAVLLRDGAGISYGRSQATDGGGNLDRIVYRYLDLGGTFADALRPFLDELDSDATTRVDPDAPPAWTRELMALLSRAGNEDPLMRQAQDEIFDQEYWVPAERQASEMKLRHPLSYAVVYDTCIHSGPRGIVRIRRTFPELPPSRGGDEKAWTVAYARARYAWLASYPVPAVRKTLYRMKTFLALAEAGNWTLDPPFKVLNVGFD